MTSRSIALSFAFDIGHLDRSVRMCLGKKLVFEQTNQHIPYVLSIFVFVGYSILTSRFPSEQD